MLGPCWQPLFALNSLAPNHSAIRLATLSVPTLHHKGQFAVSGHCHYATAIRGHAFLTVRGPFDSSL